MVDDWQCNLKPVPRWKSWTLGAALVTLLGVLVFAAYWVVVDQYEPFFLETGQWRCEDYQTRPISREFPHGKQCVLYRLKP